MILQITEFSLLKKKKGIMAGTDKNLFSILLSSSDNQWHRSMEKEINREVFNGTLGNSYNSGKFMECSCH